MPVLPLTLASCCVTTVTLRRTRDIECLRELQAQQHQRPTTPPCDGRPVVRCHMCCCSPTPSRRVERPNSLSRLAFPSPLAQRMAEKRLQQRACVSPSGRSVSKLCTSRTGTRVDMLGRSHPRNLTLNSQPTPLLFARLPLSEWSTASNSCAKISQTPRSRKRRSEARTPAVV